MRQPNTLAVFLWTDLTTNTYDFDSFTYGDNVYSIVSKDTVIAELRSFRDEHEEDDQEYCEIDTLISLMETQLPEDALIAFD